MAKKPKSLFGTTPQPLQITGDAGRKGNATGNALERFVRQALESKGYAEFEGNKRQAFSNRNIIGGKQYLTQLTCGPTIYGSERRCDFFVVNREKFPDDLIIECKWQQTSGSVDEKFPFLMFNIILTGVPTIVLVDGEGARKSAVEWLRTKCSDGCALRAVWTMNEFQREVNNGLLG